MATIDPDFYEDFAECPECGCQWSLEEIDLQECDACGWPDDDDMADRDKWSNDNWYDPGDDFAEGSNDY